MHVVSFYSFKIYFNIIVPPSSRSPKWLDTGQNLEDDLHVVTSTLRPATTRSRVAGGGGCHRVWAPSAKYRMKSSGQATRGSFQPWRIRCGDKYLAIKVPARSEMSRWGPDMDGCLNDVSTIVQLWARAGFINEGAGGGQFLNS